MISRVCSFSNITLVLMTHKRSTGKQNNGIIVTDILAGYCWDFVFGHGAEYVLLTTSIRNEYGNK